MHTISLISLLSYLIICTNSQPPLTYGCVHQILAYTPMAKLYNFVTKLNAASTVAAKKTFAKNWLTQAKMGTHLFPALDIYSTQATALTAVNDLIDHRAKVAKVWNEIMTGLKTVYTLTNAQQYKQMWIRTDRTFDNAFYDALNEWYAYSHYHSPSGKRTALYNAIQKVTKKYVNDTQLNFELPGSSYSLRFFLMMLFGMW